MSFKTLKIDVEGPLAWLRLNRPEKANAMNQDMWDELPQAMAMLEAQSAVRVVILAGEGKHFCAGIDVGFLMQASQQVMGKGCPARAREKLRQFILKAQASLSSLENFRAPVLAAVHGSCIGAGVDMIAACDLRYATADARFSIKEVDLGLAADVGTLHRLQHVLSLPVLAELTYTGEAFDGLRAERLGLLNRSYGTREELEAGVKDMALTIAAKSPLTVRSIKHNLLYARDHTVAEGLEHIATWNASMLVSEDAMEAMAAQMQKRAPKFVD